jgi:hypothetical protein
VIGFGTNVLAMLIVPRWERFDVPAHVLSLPATVYLFYSILRATGTVVPI